MPDSRNQIVNVVRQNFWDGIYETRDFSAIPLKDPVRKLIESHFSSSVTNKTCFEVGCFPGRYLAVFGNLGYELCGIDLTPRVENDLPQWFRNNGFKTGDFVKGDFLEYASETKYDVVLSMGFIEHFTNWKDVLIKHLELVKKNGSLVVVTPNYRGGVQRFIHKVLDRTNYKRHVISAMNPEVWAELFKEYDFEIVFSGYFERFYFWADFTKMSYFVKIPTLLLRRLSKFAGFILPRNKELYSPYCGIVAKRFNSH